MTVALAKTFLTGDLFAYYEYLPLLLPAHTLLVLEIFVHIRIQCCPHYSIYYIMYCFTALHPAPIGTSTSDAQTSAAASKKNCGDERMNHNEL